MANHLIQRDIKTYQHMREIELDHIKRIERERSINENTASRKKPPNNLKRLK